MSTYLAGCVYIELDKKVQNRLKKCLLIENESALKEKLSGIITLI